MSELSLSSVRSAKENVNTMRKSLSEAVYIKFCELTDQINLYLRISDRLEISLSAEIVKDLFV